MTKLITLSGIADSPLLYPYRDETVRFPIDKLVVHNHIFQVRLVGICSPTDTLCSTAEGQDSSPANSIPMLLIVPVVVPPTHPLGCFGCGRKCWSHHRPHTLSAFCVSSTPEKEQLHILLQRGEGLLHCCCHPSFPAVWWSRCTHPVSGTSHFPHSVYWSCRSISLAFSEKYFRSSVVTLIFGTPFQTRPYPKILNPSCHRHIFQIGLIVVVPVRNQLPHSSHPDA